MYFVPSEALQLTDTYESGPVYRTLVHWLSKLVPMELQNYMEGRVFYMN